MLYEKVVLTVAELRELYREDLILGDDGRMIFRKARFFQEYLGAIAMTGDSRVISKGKHFKVEMNFPGYLPARDPAQNWFQIALGADEKKLSDLLNCEARYKGFLPGTFLYHKAADVPGEFIFEDEPRFADINYALFIYDSANYSEFREKVERVLCNFLGRGKSVVSDSFGNHILVSDDSTSQPMLLVPIGLLVGGREYVCNAWEATLFR